MFYTLSFRLLVPPNTIFVTDHTTGYFVNVLPVWLIVILSLEKMLYCDIYWLTLRTFYYLCFSHVEVHFDISVIKELIDCKQVWFEWFETRCLLIDWWTRIPPLEVIATVKEISPKCHHRPKLPTFEIFTRKHFSSRAVYACAGKHKSEMWTDVNATKSTKRY